MSLPPKPRAHCGNPTFQVVPHVQLPVSSASTLLGMAVSKKVSGRFWTFTLLICTNCGSTQTFTSNAADMAQWVPGSSVVTGTPR